MKKQSHHALATHPHKAASLKAKAAKVAVRGATPDGAQRSTGELQYSVNSASRVTTGTTTTWVVCGLSLLLWALV